MMMCNRNYGNEMWEKAGVREDGIDLKKLRTAMRRDPEGTYQTLTVLLGEARAVRADPAFRFPDEDEDVDEAIEPEDSPDEQPKDFSRGLTAMQNGDMTPAEKEAYIYELAEALVKEGRPRSTFPMPFPRANARSAAVKPKSKPGNKHS